jgi:hypothetical protein
MYICIMYICMYICMYVLCLNIYMCVCMYVCMYYAFTYVCTNICVYIRVLYNYLRVYILCMYVCGSLFTLNLNADGLHYPGYLGTRVGPEALEEGQIGCSCRLTEDSLAARPSIWLLHGLW